MGHHLSIPIQHTALAVDRSQFVDGVGSLLLRFAGIEKGARDEHRLTRSFNQFLLDSINNSFEWGTNDCWSG